MTCVVRESSFETILSGIGVAREASLGMVANDARRPAAISGLVKETSCDSILNVGLSREASLNMAAIDSRASAVSGLCWTKESSADDLGIGLSRESSGINMGAWYR